MRKFFTILCLFGLLGSTKAQTTFWEGGLFLGGSVIGGDLVPSNLGSLDEVNSAYGLMLRRYLHSNMALRFNLLRSRLTSRDNANSAYASRGFKSVTPLTELSADFEFDFLGHRRGSSIGGVSPYLFGGVGLAFTNPKVDFGAASSDVILDENADYSTTRFVLPLGAGLRMNIHRNWAVALEVSARATFSDYLDGVSMSANPDKNDWYGYGSAQIWYKLTPADKDQDGIADKLDSCPEIAGPASTMGCPDRDQDGIRDLVDSCPDIPGTQADGGCPDSDKDGIIDSKDACPSQAGSAETGGCPDRDRDGVNDELDRCPDEVGVAAHNGCPVPDSDQDGLKDDQDMCPYEAGPTSNQGCPFQDADGDGLADHEDRCPTLAGPALNKGCPEVEVKQTAQDVLDFATRNVRFETDKDAFLPLSYEIMDGVAAVMREYPNYHLNIEGYTDNRGTIIYNQALSESRAKRCYEYLINQGIPAERMQYSGYGESNPIASNKTVEGRLENRRVQFSLFRK